MKVNFKELKGKIITKIENIDNKELKFYCNTGEIFSLYHDQQCCESVTIEDINGDLDNLLNTPILIAEELIEHTNISGSATWTFYKLATIKGYVDIRWIGESNGNYSETVNFVKI
jgi:hypothetical protein